MESIIIIGLIIWLVARAVGRSKAQQSRGSQRGQAAPEDVPRRDLAVKPRTREEMVAEQRRRAEAYHAAQQAERTAMNEREHPYSLPQQRMRQAEAPPAGARLNETPRQRVQEPRGQRPARQFSAAISGLAPQTPMPQQRAPQEAPMSEVSAPMRGRVAVQPCAHSLHFHHTALVNGVIMAEILGPCKAKRR